jgi:hypothetical protein
VAIENPTFDSTTNMPNIASYLQYDIAGGHTFIVSGEIADWYNDGQTPDDGAVPHTTNWRGPSRQVATSTWLTLPP